MTADTTTREKVLIENIAEKKVGKISCLKRCSISLHFYISFVKIFFCSVLLCLKDHMTTWPNIIPLSSELNTEMSLHSDAGGYSTQWKGF